MKINVQLDLDKAYDTMGMHIQRMVNGFGLKFPIDFAFIKMRNFDKEFADMVFRYKNQVYAILMDIVHNNEHISLQTDKTQKFIKYAKENNLVPCIFPIVMDFVPTVGEHGYGVYLTENKKPKINYSVSAPNTWNLINIETSEQVNPLQSLSNTPVEMSDYELENFSVLVASQELEQAGYYVDIISDMPDACPQIIFKTPKGEELWCAVVCSTKYDTENIDEYKKIFDKNCKSHNVKEDAFFTEFMNNHKGVLFAVYVKNSLRTDIEHRYKYKYIPFSEITDKPLPWYKKMV